MLSLVANETDNSVIITDADGRIEYVNLGFTKLSGYRLEDVRGREPGEVLQDKHTDKDTKARIRDNLKNRRPSKQIYLNSSQYR